MDSCIVTWRMSIGCFYNRVHGVRCLQKTTCKFSFKLSFLFLFIRCIITHISAFNRYLFTSVNNIQTATVVCLLVILAGDVETNPGPATAEQSVSLLHFNIRSIRHKLDYVKTNFLDFDILCFTETHLDSNILTDELLLSENYNCPYRKDRTNHGSGILIYVLNTLIHKRRTDLEIFWDECIWIEVQVNNERHLVGIFYSPKTSDRNFFNAFSLNLEAAFEISKNIVVAGDFNEDLLCSSYHNLRDIILANSLVNIICVPTRERALLDPIIVPEDLRVLDSGILETPREISDHEATYVILAHNYALSSSFKRTIWLYKHADFNKLRTKIISFDWKCLLDGTTNQACLIFKETFLKFAKECIPNKEVTIRPDDKPWYDSEIRLYSRKRDRQKSKALKSGSQVQWTNYKHLRNKVNNLKKHAKETFYNNLEFTLTDTFSGNKKDFWKLIRHFTRSKSSTATIPPLCSILPSGEKTYHVTDADKANCLNDYFISISSVDDTNATLPLFYEKTNKVLDKIETTEKEVQDIIDSLNLNKASGPDLISHKMIKKRFCCNFEASVYSF